MHSPISFLEVSINFTLILKKRKKMKRDKYHHQNKWLFLMMRIELTDSVQPAML